MREFRSVGQITVTENPNIPESEENRKPYFNKSRDGWIFEIGMDAVVTFENPTEVLKQSPLADRVGFFATDADLSVENPSFTGVVKSHTENSITIELQSALETPMNGEVTETVVVFREPHIGRRGKIVIAVKQALERIKQGHIIGRRQAWLPDNDDVYPMSVNCVLLEPLQPIALDRDNLLPALIVQYGDGIRKYKPYRRAPGSHEQSRNTFNTTNEVEETMTVNIRAILRPSLESTLELAKEGRLTGESLAITIANLHESIDTALGDGLDLAYNGERIEGMRELVVMKWMTPFDMWATDYAILDIPVMIRHVFHRGSGV